VASAEALVRARSSFSFALCGLGNLFAARLYDSLQRRLMNETPLKSLRSNAEPTPRFEPVTEYIQGYFRKRIFRLETLARSCGQHVVTGRVQPHRSATSYLQPRIATNHQQQPAVRGPMRNSRIAIPPFRRELPVSTEVSIDLLGTTAPGQAQNCSPNSDGTKFRCAPSGQRDAPFRVGTKRHPGRGFAMRISPLACPSQIEVDSLIQPAE